MSNLIKKPAEIVGKETIAALIYGQPGMGKSTLACSAPKPVLFDFDGGCVRMRDEHQVPTVQIESWDQAQEALRELEGAKGEYGTVIVDTLSKMVDCIVVSICGTAQPKINQWGLVNAKFKAFLRGVQSLGMNIVFVAQRDVEKDGEVTRYVPQVRASNYKDIVCDLDVMGYMEMVNEKGREVRCITFNPSSRSEGKNTADFAPAYIIEELPVGKPNTFLTDRFAEYVQKQREKAKKRQEAAKATDNRLSEFEAEVDSCTDAMSLNSLMKKVAEEKPTGDAKLRMREIIKKHAAKLNLKLNKETKLYE